ncbi:MAG: sulfatase [Myxococcota bacterium]
MRTRRLLLLSLCAVVASGCGAPPPNVLLVSIDTLRPDRLGCYGEARTTPAIDGLAAGGVRFENAFSPSPWTLPAHAAMLSGRYPGSIRDDPNSLDLLREATLLGEILSGDGFTSAAVTGGRFLGASFGLPASFDHFEEVTSGGAERAARWLRDHAGERFFLFFHTYVVHAPYVDRRFLRGADGGRLADIYAGGVLNDPHFAACCRGLDATSEEREFLLRYYDGGVALADADVARLLSALDELALREDTLVIVTSDHGEEFWEHTGRGAYHGHTLYDELLRVPLVWSDPAIAEPRVVAHPVSLVDVVPTVLARLGVEPPTGLDGVDLTPLLRGGEGPERALLAEGTRNGPERKSVRTSEGKLIVTPRPGVQGGDGERYPVPVRAAVELYAPGDRAERDNRAEREPHQVEKLMPHLNDRIRRAPESRSAGHDRLDAKTRAELRALGYVE